MAFVVHPSTCASTTSCSMCMDAVIAHSHHNSGKNSSSVAAIGGALLKRSSAVSMWLMCLFLCLISSAAAVHSMSLAASSLNAVFEIVHRNAMWSFYIHVRFCRFYSHVFFFLQPPSCVMPVHQMNCLNAVVAMRHMFDRRETCKSGHQPPPNDVSGKGTPWTSSAWCGHWDEETKNIKGK